MDSAEIVIIEIGEVGCPFWPDKQAFALQKRVSRAEDFESKSSRASLSD